MISIIDPLSIATEGFIVSSSNAVSGSLTIATQGFIVLLTEEIIVIPPVTTTPGFSPMSTGGFSGAFKKKKRIVATVVIAGQQYRQTVETDNIKLNLKDVKVVVEQNSSKPTIRIILP